MCRRYKTQWRCKRCKVPLCRSGAKSKSDLSQRTLLTCWEDHVHGLPARGDFRVGPWAADYDDIMASQRAAPAAKRRRSSGLLALAD